MLKCYISDGLWPEAKKLKEENLLNAYCTSIHTNARQDFWVVNDADILEDGYLKLDNDPPIKADIVDFTDSTRKRMYITKGLYPDKVFILSVDDLRSKIFTLKEPTWAPIPSPPA